MKTFLKFLLVTGYVFYVIAGLVFCYSIHFICHRWTIFEQAVQIVDGYSFSRQFTVGFAETYELSVKCKKTIPFEPLNSALMHDLTATYTVSNDGTVIADSNSPKPAGAAWANDYIEKGIVRFEAVPGKTYHIKVRFTRSLPFLAKTNPVAVLAVDGPRYSDAFEAMLIFLCFAALITLVGAICVLPYQCYIRFGKRKDPAAKLDNQDTLG